MEKNLKQENTKQASPENEEDLGMSITREQVRDVYFAGSSDGMVNLASSASVDLDEESVSYDE
jgi:hypothetical protein